jgi:hypothetical protein
MLSVMDVHVQGSPRFLANHMRDNILASCPQTTWEFHRESEEDVLYEFRSAGCRGTVSGVEEHEIGRITRGPSGSVRIAYAAKPEMTSEVRSRWLNLLGSEVGTAQGFPIRNLSGAIAQPSSPVSEAPTAERQIARWLQEATDALKQQEDLLAELDRLGQEAQADARAYSQGTPKEAGLRTIGLYRGRGDGSPGEGHNRVQDHRHLDLGHLASGQPSCQRQGGDTLVLRGRRSRGRATDPQARCSLGSRRHGARLFELQPALHRPLPRRDSCQRREGGSWPLHNPIVSCKKYPSYGVTQAWGWTISITNSDGVKTVVLGSRGGLAILDGFC